MSLTDIYNFWFDNEAMWFSSTPETDRIISEKFEIRKQEISYSIIITLIFKYDLRTSIATCGL